MTDKTAIPGPRPPLRRDRSNVRAVIEYDRALGVHYAIPFVRRKPEAKDVGKV